MFTIRSGNPDAQLLPHYTATTQDEALEAGWTFLRQTGHPADIFDAENVKVATVSVAWHRPTEGAVDTPAALTVEQLVALVSDGDMWPVIHGLRDRIEAENKARLPEIVEVAWSEDEQLVEAIAANGAPVTFVWGVSKYDNGWFFTGSSVTVTFANGEEEELEADFDEILTEIRGDLGGDQIDSTSQLRYEVATKAYALEVTPRE